jgi:two-component system sensor histidine kinase KdpD
LRGRVLPAEDRRVLGAFAAQVAAAYRQRELAQEAEAARPLAESDRQRTALLNAVSHDLRTPLAAAKAAISSLRMRDVDWPAADRDRWLADADAAVDRLTDLVTSLLDLSRLDAGALPVVVAPVAVEDVVSRALDHVARDVPLDVDIPAELPEVLADGVLLERVVANLVQNGVRYAPPGQPVRVAASAHGETVEIRVVDRGPGIPDDLRDSVFEPFQRRDDVPVDGAGVGLGLAVARGLTQAMGGSVTAEETPGGGATFVVSLQRASVAAAA